MMSLEARAGSRWPPMNGRDQTEVYGIKKDNFTQDETIKKVYDNKHDTRYLISPNQPKMVLWDLAIGIALIYTGLFTPWEIAFLGDFCFPDFLYLFNRSIDMLFVADMFLQFFLIKDIERPTGIETVRDQRKLAKMYLTGWFSLDFLSILPFDSL